MPQRNQGERSLWESPAVWWIQYMHTVWHMPQAEGYGCFKVAFATHFFFGGGELTLCAGSFQSIQEALFQLQWGKKVAALVYGLLLTHSCNQASIWLAVSVHCGQWALFRESRVLSYILHTARWLSLPWEGETAVLKSWSSATLSFPGSHFRSLLNLQPTVLPRQQWR